MTASIKASADGTQAIIQVGGVDKVIIGASGIEAGSFKAGAVTPNDLSQKLTSGTAQATTAGTSIDFTGIPSWVKRITLIFSGVSTNGTSFVQVQVGSGSIDTTGYLCGSMHVIVGSTGASNSTTGFLIDAQSMAATVARHGIMTLVHMGGNLWGMSSATGHSDAASACSSGGTKTLSGTLDRVRLTTVNGTDAFDAGSINILYEG